MSVINHLLLGVAAIAVGVASIRLASSFVDRGLERILVAVTFFAAAITVETMALGLFGLGGTQAALVLTAVATGLLALSFLPRPEVRVGDELAGWLKEAPTAAIVAVAGAIGVGVVWAGWAVWSPVIGVDGVYYHLPQMIRWIHEGTPGSDDYINYVAPVGSYPRTNAVAQTWGLGISKSMVTVSIWPMLNMTVLCLAGWVGLRRLDLSIATRVLAILAVASTPVTLQLAGPATDLPALSWLACGAALLVCSRDQPRLLIPVVVATGLAIGTKTIALPLAAVILVVGFILHRRSLRPMAGALAVGLGVFLVVGCFWYVRTFIEHGSPFWPWAAAPWGDPVPRFLQQYESFLSAPRHTLAGRLDQYASFMGGAVVLLSGALVLAVLRANRLLRWMGALLLGLLLIWASAPATGKAPIFDGSVSNTRYLLPAIGFAAVLIALAGRGHRRFERFALGALSIALIWNLGQLLTGEFPASPPAPAMLVGALAGAGIGALFGIPLRGRVPAPNPLLSGAAIAFAAALLTLPAGDWVKHHSKHRANFDAGLAEYLSARDDFREGDEPIWMAPLLAGPLSGDRLQHNLKLIPAKMPCSQVARLRRDGWVILLEDPLWVEAIGYSVGECLKREAPLAVVDEFRIYQPTPKDATS